MLLRVFAFVAALTISFPVQAETGGSELWQNLKSPFTTKAKYVLLYGTAFTLGLLIFEDQIVDPTQAEAVEDKPLGSASKWGDAMGQMIPNAAYTIGMAGYGWMNQDQRALRDSSLMFQASVYSVSVTTAMKYTVREPRPNNSDRRNSFPSGHATSIFSFAGYVGCRHSLPWGIAAYGLAGMVAYSRMNDNAHYLHDVTGGATIGAAYGIGMCLAEKARTGAAEPPKTVGYLLPLEGGLGAGLTHSF
jgi:membrane-associated phospholipid phosphatase